MDVIQRVRIHTHTHTSLSLSLSLSLSVCVCLYYEHWITRLREIKRRPNCRNDGWKVLSDYREKLKARADLGVSFEIKSLLQAFFRQWICIHAPEITFKMFCSAKIAFESENSQKVRRNTGQLLKTTRFADVRLEAMVLSSILYHFLLFSDTLISVSMQNITVWTSFCFCCILTGQETKGARWVNAVTNSNEPPRALAASTIAWVTAFSQHTPLVGPL